MGVIFLNLLNMSITASWLILAVLGIRLLFRRIPKWITCLLWGVVAIRLIFPFSIESVFSLQPSAEPIRTSTMVEGELIPYVPSVDSNIGVVENTVNPLLAEAFAYQETENVAPLHSDRNRRKCLAVRNGSTSYFCTGEYDKITSMCKGSCVL